MYIRIEKDLIPYRFDMEFNNGIFTFELNYNSFADFFTMDLYREDEPIIMGEKIVHGNALFSSISESTDDVPDAYLIPLAVTGEAIEVITYDNFGEAIQIYIGEVE